MIPDGYIIRLRNGIPLPSGMQSEVASALRTLAHSGASTADLANKVAGELLPLLFYWLERLRERGALEYFLPLSDGSCICIRPLSVDFSFAAPSGVSLSRFAFLRRVEAGLLLESPLSQAAIWSDSPIFASALLRLDRSTADCIAIEDLLSRTGFLEDAALLGPDALPLWDFHELLFHARSSTRRLGAPFGAQEPHRQPEPPAFPNPSPNAIGLELPDLKRLAREDPSFTQVLEARRSWSQPGADPLTLAQLAEFLYRAVHPQAGTKRVLPSAGGRHALEFYAIVHRCDGLAPGAYHYSARHHQLEPVPADMETIHRILDRAKSTWGAGHLPPDVVILVSARFPRMASRYASIAYRNILLDTGIAIEAMYLVATAMQLAPCALGLNLPVEFQKLTERDPSEETSIALFALNAQK